MQPESFIWLVCLVGGNGFPNLSVLGAYTSEELMIEAVRTLPRTNSYNMYRVPLNQFVGYYKKDGKLVDGMGRLWHHHLVPVDPDDPESLRYGWDMIDSHDQAPGLPRQGE